ncbi:hypothetical protein BJ878DRAFT_153506 [Calycina marina]|uniref:Uncharacterized protein n=1 Tax=Calycina marina TaxID=1763456 RepID=A0A9P8CHW1_9HELO|nr:hypothetical protein BJ878DRAFT_153506 [Calycina marina]
MNNDTDPDCAICSRPAAVNCECEANALDRAINQAEQKMMASVFNDIRSWVRAHAQDYILSFFSTLSTRRRHQHAQQIQAINAHAYTHYRLHPHPNELIAADAELKRGIDEDWKTAVQLYPEVLEYYYGLVDLSLPEDSEVGVRDPPLSALAGDGLGKSRRRRSTGRVGTTTVEMGGGRRRRPEVAFAAMPGYGYVFTDV